MIIEFLDIYPGWATSVWFKWKHRHCSNHCHQMSHDWCLSDFCTTLIRFVGFVSKHLCDDPMRMPCLDENTHHTFHMWVCMFLWDVTFTLICAMDAVQILNLHCTVFYISLWFFPIRFYSIRRVVIYTNSMHPIAYKISEGRTHGSVS